MLDNISEREAKFFSFTFDFFGARESAINSYYHSYILQFLNLLLYLIDIIKIMLLSRDTFEAWIMFFQLSNNILIDFIFNW